MQHISGQGEKWQVGDPEHDYPHLWRVIDHQEKHPSGGSAWFPKSEYVLVEPEKVWRNVTSECEFAERGNHLILPCHVVLGAHTYTKIPDGYRLRKARAIEVGWCFVVERFQV